jgi:ankyrin repeat protein
MERHKAHPLYNINPLYALCCAFTNDQFDILKSYIELRPDIVNFKDEECQSIFSILCDQENISIEVLDYMISKGADINYLDNINSCALQNICTNPTIQKIKFMLRCGANIHNVDRFGCTPLFNLCLVESNIAYIDLMAQNGSNLNDCYKSHSYSRNTSFQFVKDNFKIIKKNKIDKIMCMLIILRYIMCGPIIMDEILHVIYFNN